MGKKIKNKDLANRLGVSSTLVSLVLNNKADQQGIRKDTQEKVLSLAKQMGYFDSATPKNQSLGIEVRPGVLGMIVPSMDDPFVSQITHYLQKSFSSIGIAFSIVTKDPDDQRYDRLVGAFKKFFSGIILLGDAADESTIRALRSTDYPLVLIEKTIKSLRLNTVCTDDEAGASLVANHVEKLGYKNILIVANRNSFRNDLSAVHTISEALNLKKAINRPVVIELDYVVDGNESDSYSNQFDQYLRPPYRADAMIIMNAELVYPVMSLLRRKNLRVPQDMAIIAMEEGTGFDLMFSPVTCLRKPIPAMALKVSNMLWAEVKNSGKAKFKRQVSLAPSLIVRSSCGTI